MNMETGTSFLKYTENCYLLGPTFDIRYCACVGILGNSNVVLVT